MVFYIVYKNVVDFMGNLCYNVYNSLFDQAVFLFVAVKL